MTFFSRGISAAILSIACFILTASAEVRVGAPAPAFTATGSRRQANP